MQRIRYALRTLAGPWLVLPALGLETAVFLMRGMPWRGEGLWTVDWFAIGLSILGPLCAGVVAVDVSRLTRSGNIHLVVSVPAHWRVYLRAITWCCGPVIAIHLLTIAIALVVGGMTAPSVGWPMLLVGTLVQCLSVVWFTALGSAVGRFANPLLAGLIGGVLGYLLIYLGGGALTSGPTFQLLKLGGATITMLGRDFNLRYLGWQALLFAVMSVLFTWFPMRMRSGRRLPSATAVVAGIATLAAIAVAPKVLPANRYVEKSEPPTLCYGTQPRICIYPEHRRYAALVVKQVDILMRAARDRGYAEEFVPEQVMESSRGYNPSGPGIMHLWLPAETYEKGRFPLEGLAYLLLEPSHCPWLMDPESEPIDQPAFEARFFSVLATWLHLAGADLEHAPVEPTILQPDEVHQILQDFERCNLDGRG
jgi:hypothetical protein